MSPSISTWLEGGAVPAHLHLPSGRISKVGVVVCAPLAREHLVAYRTLRLLCQELEAAHIASVRFDYAGHGDSTVGQETIDVVSSARIAAQTLVDAGCTRVVYVGLTIGALIALAAAKDDPRTAGVVFWDAPRSGRQWLRRVRSLYSISVPDAAAAEPGEPLDVVGARFEAATVRLLQSLSLETSELDPAATILHAERADAVAAPEELRGDRISVDGHAMLFDIDMGVARVPQSSVEHVAEWLREHFGPARCGDVVPTVPRSSSSVTIPPSGADGERAAIERFTRVGPDGLFAVEVLPVDATADTPTVLLHTGSVEHCSGPARFQVLLSRDLARNGIRSLRLDRRGCGESSRVRGDEPDLLYTQQWLDDDAAIIRSLGLPRERVAVAGHCVGGWLALRVDPEICKVMVAFGIGSYRTGTCPPNVIRDRLEGYRQMTAATRDRRKRINGFIRSILSYRARLLLAHWGKGEVASILLTPPMRGGANITLMMSPADAERFSDSRGEQSLHRLRKTPGRVELIRYAVGDHALFEPRVRLAALQDLRSRLVSAFAPYIDTPYAPEPDEMNLVRTPSGEAEPALKQAI